MKSILLLLLLNFSLVSIGQQLTFESWNKQSQTNIRLLPTYGGVEKTKDQKKADQLFITETMQSFKTKKDASNHMVNLGFSYLQKGDRKTAMYRFNQAYLLKEDNPNIYWGYGAIYLSFNKYDLSREQYKNGLKLDPENDAILIDYGTTYLAEFYKFYETDIAKASERLDKAIVKLLEAYNLNKNNSNSSYKLAVCYLYKNNCVKANSYLKTAENIGNPNITAAFKAELKEQCK